MLTAVLLVVQVAGGPDSVASYGSNCFYYPCEEHRVRITRAGRVTFEWAVAGRVVARGSATVASGAWSLLTWHVKESHIIGLPDTIYKDPILCPDRATDWGEGTVIVYVGVVTKTVKDDHGCFTGGHSAHERLRPLRDLESAIDSLSGVFQWLPREDSRWEGRGDSHGVLQAIANLEPERLAPRDTVQWFVGSEDDSSTAHLARLTGHPVSPLPLSIATCPSQKEPAGRRIGRHVMVRWAWKTADSVQVYVRNSCYLPRETDKAGWIEGKGSGSQEYIVTRRNGMWTAVAGETVAN